MPGPDASSASERPANRPARRDERSSGQLSSERPRPKDREHVGPLFFPVYSFEQLLSAML